MDTLSKPTVLNFIERAKTICKEKNFTFISLRGKGATSICFKAEDANKKPIVIKFLPPSELEQKRERCTFIEKLFSEYKGEVKIPKTTFFEDYCIENYLGEDLPPFINYNTFDFNNDNYLYIAKELGKLLAYMHSKSSGKKSELSILKSRCRNIKKLISELDKLPDNIKSFIEDIIYDAKQLDAEDEILCTCHCDVRHQNILFNNENNSFSLIDFDLTKEDSIYADFIPYACASQKFSPEFLNELIESHNENCKFKVDKSKVCTILKLGILDEYYRCAKDPKSFAETLKQKNIGVKFDNFDRVLKPELLHV